MSIKIQIKDAAGNGATAKVTHQGQLVVAPISYDSVANQTMSSANTAYNFFGPKTGCVFIITNILINADKNVTTDEIIDIYEADSPSTTTISKSIIKTELLRNSTRDLQGLNLKVSKGKWLNGKADDASTFVTIMGYYAEAGPDD
jgi:hypothetical protein